MARKKGQRPSFLIWWVLRGSNPRPSVRQTDALPSELNTQSDGMRYEARDILYVSVSSFTSADFFHARSCERRTLASCGGPSEIAACKDVPERDLRSCERNLSYRGRTSSARPLRTSIRGGVCVRSSTHKKVRFYRTFLHFKNFLKRPFFACYSEIEIGGRIHEKRSKENRMGQHPS